MALKASGNCLSKHEAGKKFIGIVQVCTTFIKMLKIMIIQNRVVHVANTFLVLGHLGDI